MAVARMSRADRKAQTRDALLVAGRAAFERDGFHGASLDRISAEAGFTKGAVYAHFPTKAELFLAILEERGARRTAQFAVEAARAATLEDLGRGAAEQWGRTMAEESAWSLLLLEFWVHAARDPELRDRIAGQHRRNVDGIAAVTREVRERSGETLAISDQDFATVVVALGNGMNLEGLLFGAESRTDLFGRAHQALLQSLREDR